MGTLKNTLLQQSATATKNENKILTKNTIKINDRMQMTDELNYLH